MLDEFNRFKKRIMLEAILISAAIGLGTSSIVFGALFLCSKREWISLHVLFSVLIALGVFLAVFGICFMIKRPKDKKVAKRLDTEFQMNEKVQTMITYKEKEEPILLLQRQDTERRLGEIPSRKLKMRLPIFLYIVLPLGLSSVTVSAAVPKVVHPPVVEPEEPDFTLTQWQIEQLEQMIEYVKASKASDVSKGGYITQLTLLIDKLKEQIKTSQMKTYVNVAISNILLVYTTENSNPQVNHTLKATEREKLTLLGESVKDYSITDVSNVLLAIQREYEDLNKDDPAKALDAITKDADALAAQLEISVLSKQDEFYIALADYQKALASTKSISTAKVLPTVCDALNVLEPKLISLVTTTLNNRNVAWYLEDKLRDLFGLEPASDRENGAGGGSSSGDNSDSKMDGDNGGGYGAGDYIFGSSDVLYDFDQNKLVPYGELYDKYYAVINGLINDGSLSEEMIEYINQYLASLTNVKS